MREAESKIWQLNLQPLCLDISTKKAKKTVMTILLILAEFRDLTL